MVTIIEITAVILAMLLMALAAAMALRNAIAFGRTANSFQERTQPLLLELSLKSNTAQERAFSVTGKADLLQRKLYRLLVTMNKMRIQLSALNEAREKVSRILSYIGL